MASKRKRIIEDEDNTRTYFRQWFWCTCFIRQNVTPCMWQWKMKKQRQTTHQFCAPPIYRITGGPSGIRNNETSTINNDLTPLTISIMFLFFLELFTCWWKRHVTSSTWTHLTKDVPHCLIWPFRKCTCFYLLLCRWAQQTRHTESLLRNTRTVFLHCFMETRNETFLNILRSLHLVTTKQTW